MKKKTIITIIIMLMLLFNQPVKAESVEVKLKKCVDGDTARFIINDQEKSTRFLAIDTPEIKHGKRPAEKYGIEASRYTCKELKKAKKIVLEYDDNADNSDKYGRVLAWVFVDEELLQNKLVRDGYAEIKYLYGNYKYTNLLKKSETKAKKEKLNIWNDKEESNNNMLEELVDSLFDYIMKKAKSML